MATSGSISLSEVSEHTAVLAVACNRCERAGRYRLDTLIARHGADLGIPALLRQLSEIAQSGSRSLSMTCAASTARSCRRSSSPGHRFSHA
jgi:hypothetical protein